MNSSQYQHSFSLKNQFLIEMGSRNTTHIFVRCPLGQQSCTLTFYFKSITHDVQFKMADKNKELQSQSSLVMKCFGGGFVVVCFVFIFLKKIHNFLLITTKSLPLPIASNKIHFNRAENDLMRTINPAINPSKLVSTKLTSFPLSFPHSFLFHFPSAFFRRHS